MTAGRVRPQAEFSKTQTLTVWFALSPSSDMAMVVHWMGM